MDHDILQTFLDTFESLSGHGYRARDATEAAAIVARIAKAAGARRVAVAQIPADLSEEVRQGCESDGMEVCDHPYATTDAVTVIDGVQVGVTGAQFAIAQTGTLVEVVTDDAQRLVSSLPRIHIGIVNGRDVIATLMEAAPRLRAVFEEQPENAVVSFLSGPSRTGDIEMILTLGVHGPEHAHAIVITGE